MRGLLLPGLLLLPLVVVLPAACDDEGTSIEHACKQDSDCPDSEMKCVVPAGVCIGFATPLEAVDAAPRSDAENR